eukprot:6456443-Amphidinium_carterae.2
MAHPRGLRPLCDLLGTATLSSTSSPHWKAPATGSLNRAAGGRAQSTPLRAQSRGAVQHPGLH